MTMPIPKLRMLHYLLTEKSANRFLAHCLDLDLIVAGPSQAEAERRLDVIVKGYVETALRNCDYAALTTAAPPKLWDAFADGEKVEPTNPFLEILVPETVSMADPAGHVRVVASCAAPIAA